MAPYSTFAQYICGLTLVDVAQGSLIRLICRLAGFDADATGKVMGRSLSAPWDDSHPTRNGEVGGFSLHRFMRDLLLYRHFRGHRDGWVSVFDHLQTSHESYSRPPIDFVDAEGKRIERLKYKGAGVSPCPSKPVTETEPKSEP